MRWLTMIFLAFVVVQPASAALKPKLMRAKLKYSSIQEILRKSLL